MTEWDRVPAGTVSRQRREVVRLEDGMEYATMGVRWYGRGAYERGRVTTETVKAKSLFRAHAGDFVFNRIDTQKGAFDVVPESLDGALATNEFPLYETDREQLLSEFLCLYFQQSSVLADIDNVRAGSEGRARWKEQDFENWLIPLPPVDVQRRIVALVDAVDRNTNALATEVERTRLLLNGVRRDLGELGDKVPLSALAADKGIQIGPFGSQLHAHEYTADLTGIPVVMPQDLVNGEIVTAKIKRVPADVAERLKRHAMRPGDIVFPRRGDLTKRALVTDEQAGWLCGTGCLRFRARSIELAPQLAEAMAGHQTSEWLVEHAVGTTMLNLNTEILSKLPVADVSTHPELADGSIAVQRAQRSLVRELIAVRRFRSGLVSALLAQEITVDAAVDRMIGEVA